MSENMELFVMDTIQQLANKLGVATEEIYKILIRQAYISAVTWIIILIALTIFSVIMFKFWMKVTKKYKSWQEEKRLSYIRKDSKEYRAWEEENPEPYSFEIRFLTDLFSCGSILLTILLFIANINAIITNLFNPQMYVLRYIQNLIQ